MSIESLKSAADAAGYVMISEDELPETFGRKPSLFDFKALPAISLAIWRPVVPAIDGQPAAAGQNYAALGWFTGRFGAGPTTA
jgi:hypothetical protein